jgi:hypothetical protein
MTAGAVAIPRSRRVAPSPELLPSRPPGRERGEALFHVFAQLLRGILVMTPWKKRMTTRPLAFLAITLMGVLVVHASAAASDVLFIRGHIYTGNPKTP